MPMPTKVYDHRQARKSGCVRVRTLDGAEELAGSVLAHTEGTPLCQQSIHNFWLHLFAVRRVAEAHVEVPSLGLPLSVDDARESVRMRTKVA